VIEKSRYLGGTTAMSGAGTWIPANHLARDQGVKDSSEEALQYLRATGPNGWAATEDALWVAFANEAPNALAMICDKTPLEFEVTPEPDPMAEYEGGKSGGRMLAPLALRRSVAGPLARLIRPSTLPHVFTYVEGHEDKPFGKPLKALAKLWPRLLWRYLTGARGQGTALVAGLLAGCQANGVRFRTQTRAVTLNTDELGGIVGVEAEHDGQLLDITAARGVVIASGGFEWDRERFDAHFPGLTDRLASPRTNTGDGQRMAQAVGADMAHLDQANVYATVPTFYEGQLHGMPSLFHGGRNVIVVNRHARRFTSEQDYNFGERLDERDADTGEPVNTPCYMIGDQQFLKTSGMFRWYARKDPAWVKQAPSLDALAKLIGLDAGALAETVSRFNGFARAGRDEDFHRGESIWEQYKCGVPADNPAGALGEIVQAPFVAVSLNRSVLGTKGGPRTNADGQVMRADGSAIPGLYCAGVAMANPIGTRAVGAGTTIGPCLTWGYICGKAIGRTNR
jgi:3-oxosteroid 1-dehydrogenase